MRKILAVVLTVLVFGLNLIAQTGKAPDLSKGNYVISNLDEDTTRYKDKATYTLRNLKTGAVIVRLKTNERVINAYTKAGMTQVVDRMKKENDARSIKLMRAFVNKFKFCKYYFIHAKDTRRFLDGDRKVFLNSALQYDTGIVMKDTFFIFCEIGILEGDGKYAGSTVYERPKKILDTIATESSTSSYVQNALHFIDRDLNQMRRPFPMGEQLVMDAYEMTVGLLNSQLFSAYNRLVLMRDTKEKMKEDKKRQKQLLKSSK